MRVTILFCVVLITVVLGATFAKPRWGKHGKKGKKGGRFPGKRRGPDAAEMNTPGDDRGDDVRRRGRTHHHGKGVKSKKEKIRDSICSFQKVGGTWLRGMSCEEADDVEEALFCVNSKLAKQHGLPAPKRDDVTMLLGDVVPTPAQAAALADQVKGCEGIAKTNRERKGKYGKKWRRTREIVSSQNRLWTDRTIPISTSTTNPVSTTIAQLSNGDLVGGTLLDAIQYINDHTCLTLEFFKAGSTPPATRYILVQADGTGCWSYVGRLSSGQELNLDNGCYLESIVQHELTHAIGIYHEQSRIDRDDHVTVVYGNIQSNAQGNYDKCTSCINSDYEYDFGSIMHYGKYFFSISAGAETLRATDSRYDTTYPARKTDLSFLDVKQINNVYCQVGPNTNHASPLSKVCTGTDNCKNGGYLNPNTCSACLCSDYLQGTCSDGERFQGKPNNCGEDLTATTDWQNVVSGTLAQGSFCAWIITSPAGSQIQYQVTQLAMSATSEGGCQDQWLEVREGQTGVPHQPADFVDFTNTGPRFCGTSVSGQDIRITPTNKLVLIFNDEAGGASPTANEFTVRYKHDGDPTPQDCEFEWSQWTECSKTCGSGTRTRSPDITKQPTNGGKACPNPETEFCNTEDCPDVVNCQYEWNEWGACSVTCGGGTRSRTINIITEPQNGGTPCPESPDTGDCNTEPCPSTGTKIRKYFCCYTWWWVTAGNCHKYSEHTTFPDTFETLNFPNIYPYHRVCRWRLVADDPNARIQITFKTMNIEDWWDPVDIFDNRIRWHTRMYRCLYNKDCRDRSFTSKSNAIAVRHYQRDRYKSSTETGFQVSFQPVI